MAQQGILVCARGRGARELEIVEALESVYRLLTRTAETELGVAMTRVAPLIGAASAYLALEQSWGHLQAGNAVAAMLSSAGASVALLSLMLTGARAPVLLAFLAAVALVTAVSVELAYDKEEKLLEQYRPNCRNTGGYLNVVLAVKAITRRLQELAVAPHARRIDALGW
jgi:hypothetical protein